MAASSESTSSGQGKEMRQRNRDPQRVVTLRERPLQRRAVVHFRAPSETPLGDEAVYRSLLLAAK